MKLNYFVAVFCALFAVSCGAAVKKDPPSSEVVIHATNVSSVPSVHYVVDAIECLKEAYSVYADDANRAKLYAELFEEKHPETQWNVVVGYTTFQIKSQWYVEAAVTSGGKSKDSKDDKSKDVNYLIFSSQPHTGYVWKKV